MAALGDAATAAAAGAGVWGLEGLPNGSARLVVARGLNAGSRFQLEKPVTSAGLASRQRRLARRHHRQSMPRRIPKDM